LKKTITSNQPLFLCTFVLQATPSTYPKCEFRWQSPCAACNQWPQKRKKSNAVSTLQGSETALKARMKLKAAANRCLEDIFLLFLSSLPQSWVIQDGTGGKPLLVKLPGEMW